MSYRSLANFWQNIKKGWLLIAILLLGLTLRGLNPTFGSPSLFVSNDEAIAHRSALNMLASRTPISIANYTPLGAYLQIPFLTVAFFFMKITGALSTIQDFELFILTHEGYFLFIPRLISAFFGMLLILVIYKITFELFREKSTATVAAFLTAVSFNLVHVSHFGRPWAPALFFFALSFYFLLKNKNVLSLISVALSYGFHQVGILALPLIFWRIAKKPNFASLVGLAFSVLMIALFSSLTLRTGFIEAIRQDQSFLKAGKLLADLIIGSPDLWQSAERTLWGNLSIYFTANLLVTDGVLLIFGIWGIIKNFKKGDFKKEIIYYIIIYFIFASLFFHPLTRYLFPLVLLTIPFAARELNCLFGAKKYLIVPVLIIASVNSLWWNSLFIRKPTFIRASEWIRQNISRDIPIAYVGNRYKTFVPNKNAILHVQNVNKGFHRRLVNILPPNGFDNVRNIIYVSYFSGNNELEQLNNASADYGVAYVVDYYIDPRGRLYGLDPSRFEIVEHFNPTRSGDILPIAEPLFDASWNFPTNNWRPKLSMYGLTDTGPYVDILKVKGY